MEYGLTEAEKRELEYTKKKVAELMAKSCEKDPIESLSHIYSLNILPIHTGDMLLKAITGLRHERAEYEKEIKRLKSRSVHVTYAPQTSSYWR